MRDLGVITEQLLEGEYKRNMKFLVDFGNGEEEVTLKKIFTNGSKISLWVKRNGSSETLPICEKDIIKVLSK